jgi:hypothetical protein
MVTKTERSWCAAQRLSPSIRSTPRTAPARELRCVHGGREEEGRGPATTGDAACGARLARTNADRAKTIAGFAELSAHERRAQGRTPSCSDSRSPACRSRSRISKRRIRASSRSPARFRRSCRTLACSWLTPRPSSKPAERARGQRKKAAACIDCSPVQMLTSIVWPSTCASYWLRYAERCGARL